MNPVLILTRNNIDLSKRCVQSILAQDIPATPFIWDNASTDGTVEWLRKEHQYFHHESNFNLGVSAGWNWSINHLLSGNGLARCEHVLVVGNDTILPDFCYSALLSVEVPFVTGVDIGMNPLPEKPDILPLSPHPDFSCFLIRRECWETVGPFNERMKLYASDCAYHVEAHRKGIPLWKASVPYNHIRSSTLNRASETERCKIIMQANKDREIFKSIYGCLPGTPAYEALFSGKTQAR